MRSLTSAIMAVSLLGAAAAHADQLIRKGGEWQSTITGVGPQPQTMVMCFSQSTLEQATTKLAASNQCSKKDIKLNGNTVNLDFVCNTMSMKGTATLSGHSAYTADITMHIGTGKDEKVMHTVTESKWIGPCKPGERVMN